MMFDQLKALRETLEAIPAFEVSAPAREKIVAAIDALDDAMVEDAKLNTYVASLPDTPPPAFDMGRFANDFLGTIARTHAMGVTS